MSGISLRLVDVEMHERPNRLRLPFRFGVTTVTRGRQAIVKVRIRLSDGREQTGYSAEALAAKWFDKNLELSDSDNHHQLRKSLEIATNIYLNASQTTPFLLFANHYTEHVAACEQLELSPLIASYGQSLIDRAIIDALCRACGVSFYEAVNTNLLGMVSHSIIPELDKFDFSAFLAGLQPSNTINVRHTIGLSDPIHKSDIQTADLVNDGLPEALEDVVKVYKNRYFKIKVSGDEKSDLARLEQIASVLDQASDPYFVTLDGNEQYTDDRHITAFYKNIMDNKRLSRLANSIMCVEQPIIRSKALTKSVETLAELVPVIIDESDGELSAFVTARKRHYRGVSSKSCKGIYKSIINKARCEIWNEEGANRYFLSAEDLTCEPGISIQQDLALVSILGLTHVERNAHHFIDGFDDRPVAEAKAFMSAHSDLYGETDNRVRLKIRDGKFSINSLNCHGFGTSVAPDLRATEPMPPAQWPRSTPVGSNG